MLCIQKEERKKNPNTVEKTSFDLQESSFFTHVFLLAAKVYQTLLWLFSVIFLIDFFLPAVWLQNAPSFSKPISQSCSSIIICWQKCEVTSSHRPICWQHGQTAGRRSEMIYRQEKKTHICLFLCVSVCGKLHVC